MPVLPAQSQEDTDAGWVSSPGRTMTSASIVSGRRTGIPSSAQSRLTLRATSVSRAENGRTLTDPPIGAHEQSSLDSLLSQQILAIFGGTGPGPVAD